MHLEGPRVAYGLPAAATAVLATAQIGARFAHYDSAWLLELQADGRTASRRRRTAAGTWQSVNGRTPSEVRQAAGTNQAMTGGKNRG